MFELECLDCSRHQRRSKCGEARDADAAGSKITNAGRLRAQPSEADKAFIDFGEKHPRLRRRHQPPFDALEQSKTHQPFEFGERAAYRWLSDVQELRRA